MRNRELFFLFPNQKYVMCTQNNRLDDMFFEHPKHVFKLIKNNRNFTLKLLNWPNLRALSYASLLILTRKLHCASKGDALKWPVLKKNDSSNSIV